MEALDIREKGGVRGGVQQTSDRRLFMQLLAFGGAGDPAPFIDELSRAAFESVLYEDANDPQGFALLTWDDDPNFFVNILRPWLNDSSFRSLTLKPDYTMMGRTYALGHEPNLEEWLLERCPKIVTDPEWRWHVWYPLRRKGEFNSLPPEERTAILREHGRIGHSFGEAGYAHDVRLASFGIDKNDNDYVIGLIGKELFPLSACVQAMRQTR
ncbi:MAG: chlorite dismutase family protein, partial [Acidobacteriota bacterium]|nr:chlorite dismutase family protein [Acidobacteriota bacterium]